MSSGKPTDWENTKKQLLNPNPVINNRTWLDHAKDSQAGIIDLMVLEGKSTVEQIASRIPEASDPVKRVKQHLEHLQDGDSRQKNTNMKPHNLRIVEPNGILMFSLDDSITPEPPSNIIQNEAHLPSKEDFEAAYRKLTCLGESVSLDAVLGGIEEDLTQQGRSLKRNWRMITEENIKIWSK